MTESIQSAWRDNAFAALTDPLDVLIVGGGIVGSGIARDAAMRGLRVGLVEQYDFAFGTSSRSSRLLHGGLRYLAQGHFRLVRQASTEKRIVHHIAPHLCAPLPIVFPTYRGTSWPRWKLRIGVNVYDLLCGGRNLGRSCTLDVRRLMAGWPGLNPHGLTGAVRFYDGATNDARLVLDTLRSAVRHGATLCSYCRLEEARPDRDQWRCQVRDTLGDRECRVQSRCVINACGPWADKLPRSRIAIRATKGVHIVLDRARLAGPQPPQAHDVPAQPEALMMTEGRRVAYAIPWGERFYIGTTDTDYHELMEKVRTEPEDVQYLLALVNRYFPDAGLAESDLVRTWAGVRPLVDDTRGTPSDVPRSHDIRMAEDGWIDVAGGKLTTYRLMAQEVVDKIALWLRRRTPPCRTHQMPLLEPGEAGPGSAIIPPAVTPGVVGHYCDHEWAIHLDDVMVRRARWHHYHRDTGQIAEDVADWMAGCLGWSQPRRAQEIKRYRGVLD